MSTNPAANAAAPIRLTVKVLIGTSRHGCVDNLPRAAWIVPGRSEGLVPRKSRESAPSTCRRTGDASAPPWISVEIEVATQISEVDGPCRPGWARRQAVDPEGAVRLISAIMDEARPSPALLPRELREKTQDLLCEAFAEDHLRIEEFERRLDRANAATSVADLRALLKDLPVPAETGGRKRETGLPGGSEARDVLVHSRHPTLPSTQVREQSFVMAVMGGARRAGAWIPARANWVVCALGGAEIDLREAPMPPGTTHVRVYAVFGGAEIIVPPDVRVECSGMGLMGGFDEDLTVQPTIDPDAPLVRVDGLAVMGGIAVTVRYPGESKKEARRRKRAARKAPKRREPRGERGR